MTALFPQRPPTSTSWQPGQSGNPAGRWKKGDCGNRLGRPPTTRAALDAQVRRLFADLIKQRHDEYPFDVVLYLTGRAHHRSAFTALTGLITGRGSSARY